MTYRGHVRGGVVVLDDPSALKEGIAVEVAPLEQEAGDNDEMDEQLWRAMLTQNPAFDDLKEPGEDIYTMNDGKPFRS
jgi:hypothetical protein